jgi:diketogulonate reductase-like aldo/keto reductase
VDAIKQAIALGYRHLDAAEGNLLTYEELTDVSAYGTEEELGVALKQVDVPRNELFITTKVLLNVGDPEKALKTSLKKLQLDYVDLYLIHAPFNVDVEKAWQSLETLRDQGRYNQIAELMDRTYQKHWRIEFQNRRY